MNLKTSFCNKTIIKSDFKRLWWIPALHTLALFLFATFPFISMYYNNGYINNYKELSEIYRASYLFDYLDIFSTFGMLIPVILGVMLFSYMQTAKSVSFSHGMPVSRRTQFLSHVVSGVLMMIIPLLLNASLLLALRGDHIFSLSFKVSHLFLIVNGAMIYGLLFFSIAVLMSFLSGKTIAAFVFTYIAVLLPISSELFINTFLDMQLYGYAPSYSLFDTLYISSGEMDKFLNVLLYIGISVVCLVVSYLLYKARNLENHSEVVAFPKLRPVFIYGVGICSGCLGFGYFNLIWDVENALWLIPFGILGITIAMMLVKKSFRIRGIYKPLIVYSLIIMAVFCVLHFDLTGFENRVPSPDDVKYVDFDMSRNYYYRSSHYDYIPRISEPEAIEAVTKIHNKTIENKDRLFHTEYLTISYKLKNGRKISRYYEIDTNICKEELEIIMSTDAVRFLYFPILRENAPKYFSLTVNDYRVTGNNTRTVEDEEEIFDRIIQAIKKDMMQVDSKCYTQDIQASVKIDLEYHPEDIYGYYISKDSINIYNSCKNTLKILEELGLVGVAPKAENVSKIGITYTSAPAGLYNYDEDLVCYAHKVITDREQIAEVLDYVRDNAYEEDGEVKLNILLDGGKQFVCYFSTQEGLPEIFKSE